LGGASPYQLAAFALAILHVNVPAGILQTTVLELAVYIDALVQNHMLILENLVLVSIHRFTWTACWKRLDEATIHATRMQARDVD
jgi:hypothetical protein